MKVERSIEISAAHRLWGYDGKCSNLHGHNYTVTLELESDRANCMNDLGIFVDFGIIKTLLRKLENAWDHKLHLNKYDTLCDQTRWGGACVIYDGNPTAENMCEEAAKVFIEHGIFDLTQVDAFTVYIEETKNNIANRRFFKHQLDALRTKWMEQVGVQQWGGSNGI